MRKKLFSLCMALALCLGLLPATALAVDAPATLYVGNQQVISSSDITYWTTDESTGGLTKCEGNDDSWNVKYEPNTATLTLRGATIQGGSITGSAPFDFGIYALSSSNQPVALTIELIGTNTITGTFGIFLNAEIDASSYGTNATLTITSENNGSLQVSGLNYGIYVKSGTGNASLTIKDASVVAKTTTQSYSGYAGVYVQSGASATNSPNISLSVDGGSLTASASEGNDGIQFYVGSSKATGATTSLTVSDNAIVDAKTGGIKASDPNPNDLSDQIVVGPGTGTSGGIVWDGKNGTVYGNVTLQENITIGEGESLTVPDGSSLNCNDKLTNNGTILACGGTVSGQLKNGTTVTTPSITGQPQNKKVTAGENAEFSVTATTGSETPTYQWQQSTDSGSNWTDISGATSASYTTDATTTSMSGYQYRCVVKSASGVSVISQAATLTVKALPEPEPEPTPPPYIPPTYAVTTPDPANGTVTVSPSRASSGRTVTITAAPDLGFALESLTVLDSRGNEIALTDKGDGKYTFTMPASRVTVEASFTPAPLPFEDVAPGAWYESAVRYAYLHDIMEGMSATTFQPNGTLSRAMAVQIFYNLEGQPDVSDENLGYPYEDVNAQAWYGNAVYWARLTGVATGYGDGTFQPTDSITRQEFAQMLYNYAKYKGYDLTAEGDLSQFPDSGSVADWAEIAMSWANGNELINGHDGTIDAAGAGTRAQAASILMRFDQNLVEK